MIRICSKRIAKAYKNRHSEKRQKNLINLSPNFKALGDATIMFYCRCSNCVLTTVLENGPQVETLDNPFAALVDIEIIESFMHTVCYQGVVDKVSAFYTKIPARPWQTMFKKKDVIRYPRFTKLIIADLMKKYPSIPLRFEEDYHSIKDDIPLIRATNDFKEYEMVFRNIVVPVNQPQPVGSTQGTHRTTPRAYRTPTLTIASPQGKKRKQNARDTSEKDVESYANKFVASMIHDDVDDSRDRIEPGSHKEHLKVVVDDDDNKEEKKYEKEGDELGSWETRTEKMQTLIPTKPRSPRINLSSDKNIAQELKDTVSLSPATTSKDPHKER
ncbi:hypothetical protein Tco_1305534 [Tanacetum coccineum]